MPFTFAALISSAFSFMWAKKFKNPMLFIVLVAGVLQAIGFALLASLPATSQGMPRAYGFQVIAGFGCGINISTLLLIVPFVVEYRDKGKPLELYTPSASLMMTNSCGHDSSYTIESHGGSHCTRDCHVCLQQLHPTENCRA